MSLDINKLVGAKRLHGKIVAQCPVCALAGHDKSQEHLVIFNSGKFGCVIDSSDDHKSAIWQLVGKNGTGEVPDYIIEEIFAPEITVERTWPTELLDRLVKDHSYWNKRGISDETIAPFRGGLATEGQMRGRYVFPIFNDDGKIIGFDGRWTLGQTDKPWKILGPSRNFIWGGLDAPSDELVLVESIGDSLMLREHGIPHTRCMFGVNLSETLLGHLISENPRKIKVALNRDSKIMINGRAKEVGQESAYRIKKTLDKFFNPSSVEVVFPPLGVKDWGVATKDQIHQIFEIGAYELDHTPSEV